MYEVVALIVLVVLGKCTYNMTAYVLGEIFGVDSVVTSSMSFIVWFFVFALALKLISKWLGEE